MFRRIEAYKDTVFQIIGAAMKVHRVMNYGLAEPIYQEALAYELSKRGLENTREQEIEVFYEDYKLEKRYRADIVVGDIIIELKSVKQILPEHRSQLCNYLRLTKLPIGLLINFGKKSLQGERWVYNAYTNECHLVDVNMNPLSIDDDYLE